MISLLKVEFHFIPHTGLFYHTTDGKHVRALIRQGTTEIIMNATMSIFSTSMTKQPSTPLRADQINISYLGVGAKAAAEPIRAATITRENMVEIEV